MPYLDTSLLGSYYCPEPLSRVVTQAMTDASDLVISPMVELEFYSLVAMKVRMRALTPAAGQKTLAQFRMHLGGGYFGIVEIGPREYDIAKTWMASFNIALRTVDALHLACAFIQGHSLWTSDKPLAQAAKHVGVEHRLIAARH